jgi:hypothetical protein
MESQRCAREGRKGIADCGTFDGLQGLFQRGHVDDEAVFDVALEDALVGFVDLLDADKLDIGGDAVLAAEIEHLLRFGDAADEAAGEAAATPEERERADGERLFRGANEDEDAIGLEHLQISVDVVIGGDAVEDEVEALGVLFHLVGIFRDDDLVRAEAARVICFAGRSGEKDGLGAEGSRKRARRNGIDHRHRGRRVLFRIGRSASTDQIRR